MNPIKRVGLLAGAAALILTGGSFADTTPEATTDHLRTRVAELEATVAELQGNQGDNWLTEQRADEIRGLVQDVLADADTREAFLMQRGGGYDDGFVIGGGNFSLKINGQMQIRYVWNDADGATSFGGDDHRWGFENTRTKLMFSGNVINSQWGYYLEGNFGRDGGEFEIDDAWISYDYGNGLSMTVGRYKDPLLREEMVHSSKQLAVERSMVGEFFTNDRVQGLMVYYDADAFRAWGSVSNGPTGDSAGTFSTEDTEIAFTARVEGLISGNWDQFDDFTSPQNDEMGIMLGGAFHYSVEEYGTATIDELEITVLTVDISAELGGMNFFGALMYRTLDDDAAVDFDQTGVVLHGGYYMTEDWEIFGRYEWADTDDPGDDDISILTVGVNYYLGGSGSGGVKWTTDVGIGLDGIPGFAAGTAGDQDITGFREDGPGEDGQFVLRSQLQLTF